MRFLVIQPHARDRSGFTLLVWQKLEEQNPTFFGLYEVALQLKDQISVFNHLVRSAARIVHASISST